MIQKALIIVCNSINRFTKGFHPMICIGVVFFCCCALEATAFLYIGYRGDGKDAMIYGSILTMIIALFSVNGKTDPIKWDKLTIVPLILFGIGMILIWQIHPIGGVYLIYAADLITVFPFLYFVWANRGDYHVLMRCLALAALLEGLIVFIHCLILSVKGELGVWGDRVSGHTSNPNLYGLLGLIMLISSLYLTYSYKKNIWIRAVCAFEIGAGASMMVSSASRTALICAIGTIVVHVVFLIKRMRMNNSDSAVATKSNMTLMLSIALMAFLLGMMYDNINSYRNNEKTAVQVNMETEKDSSEVQELQDRITLKDKDLNTFSSGRIRIWKVYIRNLSLLGKSEKDIEHEFDDLVEWRAHNNFIDYYYRFGYIVASFYALFFITIVIKGIKILLNEECVNGEHFFVVVIIGCYAFYSLVEIAVLPFTRVLPCMFFISIAPLMTKKEFCK